MNTVWKVEWKVATSPSLYNHKTEYYTVIASKLFAAPEAAEAFKLQLKMAAALLGSVVSPTITPIEVVGEVVN